MCTEQLKIHIGNLKGVLQALDQMSIKPQTSNVDMPRQYFHRLNP